jgi:hypothetical protein
MSPSLHDARRAVVALLLASGALVVGPVAAAAAVAPDLSGACTDPDGVTVVVDLTELGGGVEVGCAPTAATGAEALVAAGFTDTRDAAGLVCAIEAAPEPCPAEFTGTYWSYWSALPDGDWTMYMEGPDTAVPAPGSLEGWRYGDGSAGPTVAVADVVAAAGEPAEPTADPAQEVTADDEADPADSELAATQSEEGDGPPAWLVVVVGLGALGAGAAVLVGLARRRRDISGPPGQD